MEKDGRGQPGSSELAKAGFGTRRDAKSIYYSIADADIRAVLLVLYGKFCAPRAAAPKRARVNGRRAAAR